MLLGKFFSKIDNEFRFRIPASYKRHLSSEVYITKGFDRNVLVLSSKAFLGIYNHLKNLNITDPLARLLFRLILGAAIETGVTSQGYLKIHEELCEYAEINQEILLIGQGDYFEIWSPNLWQKQEAELKDAETNTERFSTFNITTQ